MQILPFIAAAGAAIVASWIADRVSQKISGRTINENLDNAAGKVLYLVKPEPPPDPPLSDSTKPPPV